MPKETAPNGRASIEDVARAARVSTATVSRVINNADVVSPGTADRVRAAIRRLGYRPNLFAKGLITRQSNVLGVVVPDVVGEFFTTFMRSAAARARQRGYHVLFSDELPDESADTPPLPVEFLDGMVLMVTWSSDPARRYIDALDVPAVVVDAKDIASSGNCVIVDNVPGTVEAVEHLLGSVPAGRCFFVGGPSDNYDGQERARCFADTLANAGAAPRAGQVSWGEYSVSWGQDWARAWLDSNPDWPAGVLAGNDDIAYGVLATLTRAGVRVPDDVRIVGFDDSRVCQLAHPTLSSVRIPIGDVADAAVDLLIDAIREGVRGRSVRLGTQLMVRESSRSREHAGD